MVIGIIGAGASGMAAALAASENPNVNVILMDRQNRVGRKLQATGNGRCNLSNMNASKGGYHGEQPDFVLPAIGAMNPDATLKWFRDLGLYTVVEPSGKVYPYSDQANSVVDVLRLNLNRPNITLKLGFEAEKIQKNECGFSVIGSDETVSCDKLIIACGGLAGTKLGGTMSGYKLLGKLGHKATRLRPSLVQIKTGWGGIAGLKGVRANCHVQILRDGKLFAESTGELQLTEQGISGPVVFEISRDVCYGAGVWTARLDFLPYLTEEQVSEHITRRRVSDLPMEELLTGILHNRLGRVLTKTAGVKGKEFARELNDREAEEICRVVKALEIPLTEPLGMDSAQVTAGGVLTKQFDAATMESRLVPNLYACGEVLDIDGDCGGYNLQWAWSSGRMAGLHAGKESQ